MSPPSSISSPPVIAGRYRIVRRLATGGMAEVWLAEDLTLQRDVAIKVLKSTLAADATVAERFRREAKAAASLSHPNIVAVYDTIDSAERLAVVMQYVPGKSLRQTLDERQVLSPELVIRIARAVASALDHAHSKGIVHRDVKPGNIMLTPDNQVLLTDFGIAKATTDGGSDLTRDDMMMGTAKYISPEQVRGKKLDGRADLYSLGLVLYECLAGKVPFQAVSDVDMALARLQRDPTPLGRYVPSAAPGLIELIHRLLSRDPNDRPASGRAVQSTLDTVVAAIKRRDHTPSGDTGNAARPAIDRTPTTGADRHGRPARGFQQRMAPSNIVVAALLLGALILGGLIWSSLSDSNNGAAADPSAVGTVETVTPTAPPTTAVGGPRTVIGTRVFDVAPGDGEENDAQLELLTDGDVTTSWNTVCYENRFMGGKGGVGIVVDVEGTEQAVLDVTMGDAPWALSFYASSAPNQPDSLAAWGAPIGSSADQSATNTSIVLDDPSTRHVMIWLSQLARADRGCSGQRPWKGSIAEVTLSPS